MKKLFVLVCLLALISFTGNAFAVRLQSTMRIRTPDKLDEFCIDSWCDFYIILTSYKE